MKLDKAKLVNKYKISEIQFELVVKIINVYLQKISEEGIEDKTNSELIGLLGIMAEIIPVISNKEYGEKMAFQLVEKLLINIIKGEITTISLHEGLSNIGLFIFEINKETSLFTKELTWLNEIIYKILKIQFQHWGDSIHIKTAEFDVITGLSGSGNYLLQFSYDSDVNDILIKICEYLVNVVVLPYNENKLPTWKIDLEDEPLFEYYASYEAGYINYTVSHGCGGILLFLVHAYNKGIIVKNHKKAIEAITKEYFLINKWSNGEWWSGIISVRNYEKKDFPNVFQRQSWCSGNLSALYAIYKATHLLENKDMETKILQEIQVINDLTIDEYGLYSPIICHGYAGTLAILRNLYDETNAKSIHDTMTILLKKIIECSNERSRYCFENKKFPKSKIEVLNDDNTFLNGAAGVIIELISLLKENSSYEILLLLK